MKRLYLVVTLLLGALLCISPATQATAAETYTVTFESNGGSHVAPYEAVLYGTLIARPTDPTRQGSAFLGWYSDPALTNEWDFSQHRVTQDLTLYAKWSNLHRIFMENGKADVTYAHFGESVYIRADSPSWGYSFHRWTSTPTVPFTDRYDDRTRFIMPNRSVIIRATYRYTGGWDGSGVSVGGCAAGAIGAAGMAKNVAAIVVLTMLLVVTKRRR